MTDTLTHATKSPPEPRPPRQRQPARQELPFGTVESIEERRLLVADRPITFDEWVKRKDQALYELLNGSLVEKMAASIEHELLFIWLATLMNAFASHHGLGKVLGSRTAVRITQFNGRLPDIVFVRKERVRALRKRGIYAEPDLIVEIRSPGDYASEMTTLEAEYRTIGVSELWLIDPRKERVRALRKRGIYAEPDLIVEIRSPGDYASEMTTLEAEYRTIGVSELWLIDPRKKRVRVLRRAKDGYSEEEVREGALTSSAVEGFTIQADWLWTDDRPEVFGLLQKMLAG